ncbi:ParB/RepB/Spo0J family partition protein [Dyella sp. 20L07]|uniref:ParB/RepB/Spo0J family partition protein n=1 Tax=Dyella sp. 20L07 TaxID=3384240 RepID=UPI003D29AC30
MIVDALKHLASAKEQMLPLSRLNTHEAFQPRFDRIVPRRDQAHVQRSSTEHIDSLRLKLAGADQEQLIPVLVAEIADSPHADMVMGLYVIDGHHRLQAYRSANRKTIPARICAMDYQDAVMASKLANCDDRSLRMHDEQQRDSAWQYLAHVTQRGSAPLPDGESLRKIGARFGIGKNTVAYMLKCLPEVNIEDYNCIGIDPGTGWPRWQCVRQSKSNWKMQNASPDQRAEYEALMLINKVSDLVERASLAARTRVKSILADDKMLSSSQADAWAYLADLVDLHDPPMLSPQGH